MKPKFYTGFVLGIVAILQVSCKSAGKLYREGNYDEAVEVAVKKLQKKPGDEEMKTLLQNAYRYAVTDHETRIAGFTASGSDLKNDWIYNEYADLQNLYNAIYRAPDVFRLVNPVDYSTTVAAYRQKAGEAHVARGISWMKQPDKEEAKRAYREFQTALGFLPGDLKTEQYLNDSYNAALTRIVVTQTDDYAFQYGSYTGSLQTAGDEMIRDLARRSGNEFVKFYSAPDARQLRIEPDQVIELHLNEITIGRVQETRISREISREVVTKEIVVKPDSVVKVYSRVKATLTTTKRWLVSGGNLDIRIRDYQGRLVWNDPVYGENRWSTEYTSYRGDERALSDEDKHLINRRPDNIPGEMSIIEGIRHEIYNNALYRIRDYYSRY